MWLLGCRLPQGWQGICVLCWAALCACCACAVAWVCWDRGEAVEGPALLHLHWLGTSHGNATISPSASCFELLPACSGLRGSSTRTRCTLRCTRSLLTCSLAAHLSACLSAAAEPFPPEPPPSRGWVSAAASPPATTKATDHCRILPLPCSLFLHRHSSPANPFNVCFSQQAGRQEEGQARLLLQLRWSAAPTTSFNRCCGWRSGRQWGRPGLLD